MKELFYVDFDDKEEDQIRTCLLRTQLHIAKNNLPVILVLGGLSGSGRNNSFNHLWSWMNARDIEQNAYEKKLPENDNPYRRYWRDLPSAGKLGVYLSSWYTEPLTERAYRNISVEEYEKKIKEIKDFEKTLADNGYIILKYWLDISKKHTEDYLHYLEEGTELRWKMMEYDYDSFKHYDDIKETLGDIIEKTDKKYAPWNIISEDTRSERVATMLKSFCADINKIIENGRAYHPKQFDPEDILPKKNKIDFSEIEFEKKLSKSDYDEEIMVLRAELNELFRRAQEQNKKVIVCFEGPDASGKGGVILRLTSALNPRLYHIFPISAPTEEEKKHHYLWRFWNKFSEQKLLSVFDRSWYGRVLVERVEGFADESSWLRSYEEINKFEKQLDDAGNIVIKVLLYIDKDEQLERFEARKDIEYKQWKITDEDWRNREKWNKYDDAFADMIALTDTEVAPWVVVATNNKKRARVKTMRKIKKILEQRLLEE